MTTSEYNPHQFHDNLIRGIYFASDGEDFTADLHLDIDHILEWVSCSTEVDKSIFSVSQAILKFHDISDLAINLNWGGSGTGQRAFFCAGAHILKIEREEASPLFDGTNYYQWQIITDSHNNTISFGASGMTLELVGEPKQVNRQSLLNSERD